MRGASRRLRRRRAGGRRAERRFEDGDVLLDGAAADADAGNHLAVVW